MEHKAFIIYKSHCKIISKISNEKKWILLQKIIDYHETWEIYDTDIQVDMAFEFMRVNFDIDRERYEKKCEILSENWKRWGLAKARKWKQKLANAKNQSWKLANHSNEVEVEEEDVKEDENQTEIKNKLEEIPEWTLRKIFFEFLFSHCWFIEEKLSQESLNKIEVKIKEFVKVLWEQRTHLEIESFIEHHRNNKTVFKSTIGRLNTWLSNKLPK